MDPGAVTSFAQLAQGYFQAVTTAVALTMEAAAAGAAPDAIDAAAAEAARAYR
jgi:hypothetical protein